MKAVLLAAGKGERLGPIVETTPKPMLRIDGKPILEHLVVLCRRHGFSELYINLHHLPEAISGYFGDGSRWGVRITYKNEAKLLGTAGAVKNFERELRDGPFLVLYGDNLSDYDLGAFARAHAISGAAMSIAVSWLKNVRHSGVVDFDPSGRVNGFIEKPDRSGGGWVNMGVYILEPKLLRSIPRGSSDFGKDVIPAFLKSGLKLAAVRMPRRVKAVDTPAMYRRWSAARSAEKPRSGSRAVFLDRDGVLNKTTVREGVPHPPSSPEEFRLLPGVTAACASLKKAGFLLIVVTNQPDVARGRQTRRAVEAINALLRRRLRLDDALTCYHDDSDGCSCRKPKPGLLRMGARRWGVDLAASFMVGDRWSDVEAGQAAGCASILVLRGYSRPERCRPDAAVADLRQAAEFILTRTGE